MSDKSDTPRTDAERNRTMLAERSAALMTDHARDLERELTAAQKDAERYRWMKANVTRIPIGWFQVGWDTAIDAAIAAEKQPPPA